MNKPKLFYQGIPINEYCQKNNINTTSIRTFVWKKRQKSQFSSYTDDELVAMAIENYGKTTKYMYQGITLRQYCLSQNLSFNSIYSRILNLQQQHPEYDTDTLVKLSIEEFKNSNYCYFYHGIPLVEWCEHHPEVKYSTIKGRIQKIRKINPDATVDEIVDEYLTKEHFGIYNYYYHGIPLKQYVIDHSLNYKSIIACLGRTRKKHPELSDDELVNLVINTYTPEEPKYMYQGTTLRQYCKSHNLSYEGILTYVKRRLASNKNLNLDDLIDEAINNINKKGIEYYYQGEPLIHYCRRNNLNIRSIRGQIIRKRKANPTRPLDEIIEEAIKNYQGQVIKYYYHDESLLTFCKRNGLNYATITNRYLQLNLNETEEERKVTIANIVDDVLKNQPTKVKYTYDNQSLYQYCLANNYPYPTIIERIRRLKEKYSYNLDDEVVAEAILSYEEQNIIKTNYQFFTSILEVPEEEITSYLHILKIPQSSLDYMTSLGFNKNQSILIIYFLNPQNNSITNEEIKKLYTWINNYQNNHNLDFYILYVLYKTHIIDTSTSIIKYFESFINEYVTRYSSYYNSLPANDLLILKEELNNYIISIIDYLYLNDPNKLMRHFLFLLGEKIRNFYENKTSISLKKNFT